MSEPFVLPPPPEGFLVEQDAPGWLDGRITHISASSLRMLRICPEQYRQRYILGRKERPGEALTMGSAVHDALKFTHRQKIDSHEDLPVPVLVEYFNDVAWPEALASDGGVDEIRWDNEPDHVRGDGARVTAAYQTVVSPRVQPVRVEERFEYMTPGVPVPVVGYIDVEEEANSVDVKTGKQVTKKPDANWRMQGSIYSAFTGKPTHFHSISRAKTPSIATPLESELMVVNVETLQMPQLEKTILDFAWQLEWYFNTYGPDESWPTNGVFFDYKGGPACQFCGFRKFCPAWEHERPLG